MRRRTFLLFLIWFVILLPALRIFWGDLINPSPSFREFIEKEEDLLFLIEREGAFFPDDFLPVRSQWDKGDDTWSADWHIYEPYLKESKDELEEFRFTYGETNVKKKKKRDVSPQEYWAQVYSHLGRLSNDKIENIGRAFLWYKEQNELDDRQLLNLIVQYIQQIPYELPENEFGLYTPPEVIALNKGDCDSKSVFAAVLLSRLGYDVAVFYSSEYLHAMLGINVPSAGVYKELNGRTYYFTEMTARGWQIGDIPSDCSDPDFWYISKL